MGFKPWPPTEGLTSTAAGNAVKDRLPLYPLIQLIGSISSGLISPSRKLILSLLATESRLLTDKSKIQWSEKCWARGIWMFKSPWTGSSGMYLSLSSLTVLRLAFNFTSYRRGSIWVTRLARNFNLFPSEDHYYFRVVCWVCWFWNLGELSLFDSFFICEIAMAEFLFHVAET